MSECLSGVVGAGGSSCDCPARERVEYVRVCLTVEGKRELVSPSVSVCVIDAKTETHKDRFGGERKKKRSEIWVCSNRTSIVA